MNNSHPQVPAYQCPRSAPAMRRAFTLIELLVVLAIVGVLAAILYPVFSRAREAARRASCASNIHQIALAGLLYSNDNGRLPVASSLGYPTKCGWPDLFYPYVRNAEIFSCPNGESDYNPACGETKTEKYAGSYNLICSPLHVTRTQPSLGIYIVDGNGVAAYPLLELPESVGLTTAEILARNMGPVRHDEGYNVGFLDGHVKWFKPENLDNAQMWGLQFPHSSYGLDPPPGSE